MLFISGSYYASCILNESFSVNIICSLFHLLILCLTHTISSIIGLKYSIQGRMNLFKDKTTYFKQLLAHQEYLRCLILTFICMITHLFIIILIYYDLSRYSIEILLTIFILLPQILIFTIYISPRKMYMREYRNRSPLGKFFGKIHLHEKVNHVLKEVSHEKY